MDEVQCSTDHKKTPAMFKNVGIDGADDSLEERQRNYRDRVQIM